jgi:hypothetical protein
LHTHSFQPNNQALQNIYTFCIVIISWWGYCKIKTILEVGNKKIVINPLISFGSKLLVENQKKGWQKRSLCTYIKKIGGKNFFSMTHMFAKNTFLLPQYIMMSR